MQIIQKYLRKLFKGNFLLIYYLKGILTNIEENFIVIEANGIGYKCFVDSFTCSKLNSKLNQPIQLFTEMAVREDSISLFGFLDRACLKIFKMLTGVSGVGSKVALSILSIFSPEDIYKFILAGDSNSLTKAAGLGKKLAQRIILELKDKIERPSTYNNSDFIEKTVNSGKISQAVSALTTLGYTQKDVMPILVNLNESL